MMAYVELTQGAKSGSGLEQLLFRPVASFATDFILKICVL